MIVIIRDDSKISNILLLTTTDSISISMLVMVHRIWWSCDDHVVNRSEGLGLASYIPGSVRENLLKFSTTGRKLF